MLCGLSYASKDITITHDSPQTYDLSLALACSAVLLGVSVCGLRDFINADQPVIRSDETACKLGTVTAEPSHDAEM